MKRKGSDYLGFFPGVRGTQGVRSLPGAWLVDLRLHEVPEPRSQVVCGRVCGSLVAGFRWLYFVPHDARHALLAILNADGQPEWLYIDVCAGSGLDEQGQPYVDDLYLDVVALCTPDWRVTDTEIIDADELEAALGAGLVTSEQATFAWAEARAVQAALRAGTFAPLETVRGALVVPDML